MRWIVMSLSKQLSYLCIKNINHIYFLFKFYLNTIDFNRNSFSSIFVGSITNVVCVTIYMVVEMLESTQEV